MQINYYNKRHSHTKGYGHGVSDPDIFLHIHKLKKSQSLL